MYEIHIFSGQYLRKFLREKMSSYEWNLNTIVKDWMVKNNLETRWIQSEEA